MTSAVANDFHTGRFAATLKIENQCADAISDPLQLQEVAPTFIFLDAKPIDQPLVT